MKNIFVTLISAILFFASCNREQTELPKKLSTEGFQASGPYVTKDHKGNPVLCWTEQDPKDSLFRLKYAVYDVSKSAFGPAITVSSSAGAGNAAESMGKVAFKKDGTIIAMFAKRFLKEKNPFAGAIFYSLSSDAGEHWSDAQYLHSDTSHTYGRSFFDIAVLKDGELGAIWLDGRFGKTIKGSALYFAKTKEGKGFGDNICLEKGTCECCRTDIFTDGLGNIHLAYRNIMYPSVLSGKQVRDMVYKVSQDNGTTFSDPKTISNDNWEIEGCPHSGPSLAQSATGMHALWFTAGGGTGLYYTSSQGLNGNFNKRTLISSLGRHPQMIALKNDAMAMVFEEGVTAGHEHTMKMDHSKADMKMNHGPAQPAKLILNVVSDGKKMQSTELSNGQFADHHAVLTAFDEQLLVAWVRDSHSGSAVYYTIVKTN